MAYGPEKSWKTTRSVFLFYPEPWARRRGLCPFPWLLSKGPVIAERRKLPVSMDDIYNTKILEFAGNIPLTGAMPDADATADAHSKLCGSRVKVYVKMDGDVVSGFSHEVKACALGQASSSVMARHVMGATAEEIRVAKADMLAMLKDGGEGPSGRFEDMRYLKPVKDYRARHASTMLTFDAVVKAIDEIEARRETAPLQAQTSA